MRTKKPQLAKKISTPHSELSALEDQIGHFMQYWGFKKIHGRIWTHIYTSSVPLDTAELMKRLKVSKGLMSLAIRELIKYSVIIENNVGRHGTVYYTANENLSEVITNILKQREMTMLTETSQSTQKILKMSDFEFETAQLNREKIKSLDQLTISASQLLSFFLMQAPEGHQLFSNFSEICTKEA